MRQDELQQLPGTAELALPAPPGRTRAARCSRISAPRNSASPGQVFEAGEDRTALALRQPDGVQVSLDALRELRGGGQGVGCSFSDQGGDETAGGVVADRMPNRRSIGRGYFATRGARPSAGLPPAPLVCSGREPGRRVPTVSRTAVI